jgi:hypothetical protein
LIFIPSSLKSIVKMHKFFCIAIGTSCKICRKLNIKQDQYKTPDTQAKFQSPTTAVTPQNNKRGNTRTQAQTHTEEQNTLYNQRQAADIAARKIPADQKQELAEESRT